MSLAIFNATPFAEGSIKAQEEMIYSSILKDKGDAWEGERGRKGECESCLCTVVRALHNVYDLLFLYLFYFI